MNPYLYILLTFFFGCLVGTVVDRAFFMPRAFRRALEERAKRERHDYFYFVKDSFQSSVKKLIKTADIKGDELIDLLCVGDFFARISRFDENFPSDLACNGEHILDLIRAILPEKEERIKKMRDLLMVADPGIENIPGKIEELTILVERVCGQRRLWRDFIKSLDEWPSPSEEKEEF